MNLWLIFLTGLTTGGLTCLAVQGGLLASMIASREEEDLENKIKAKHTTVPILMFLLAKLVAYTILGVLLGLLGSFFKVNSILNAFMQILVGLFMIVTALRILDVHPFFRNFVITTPRFITKFIRNKSKSSDYFAPLFLGFLTIFIPCGTTQAMEVLAIGSGSAVYGGLIMFSFILGTSPIFFILGSLATKLGDSMHRRFLRAAAILILLLGVLAVDTGLVLAGSPISISTLKDIIIIESAASGTSQEEAKIVGDYQYVDINVQINGYFPNEITVKKGIPVRMKLITNKTYGCSRSIVIPSLGLREVLPETGEQVYEFTPTKEGTIPYSCSMGMYRGKIIVKG